MADRIHKKALEQYTIKDGDVSVSYRSINDSNTYALHWHNYIEIELVTEGYGRHDLNGTEYEASPGTVYILRPSDFHNLYTEGQMKLYNISIAESALTPEILNQLALYTSGIHAKLCGRELETATALAKLMLDEYRSSAPDSVILQKLLDCFVITVLKKVPSISADNAQEPDPVNRAVTYINMHFIDDPALADAANVAHYNPSHFSTRFHEMTGVSYSEYLSELKIKYSKRLLISTGLKVCDIAFKSGFSSQSNFLRVFKKKVGISPLKFRNKYRR